MNRFTILIGLLLTALAGLATGKLLTDAFWAIRLRNANSLSLGAESQPVDVAIPFQKPVELDYLTKAEVLDLRTAAVMTYPDLLSGSYKPSEAVFGQIIDGLPWWGMKGHSFHGNGQYSIDGASEESRFLLNPYLLLAADFYGLGSYSSDNFNWDRYRITDADLNRDDFPLDCYPYGLHWWPAEARAEVHYNITRCKERVRPWALEPSRTPPLVYFDLIAYNARDLNLNYVYVVYEQSSNISNDFVPTDAYEIPHYLHQGGSCGYPGGCNNMSPPTPEIDSIFIDTLPAQMIVWLWKDDPDALEEPEMTFTLFFE